MIRSLQALTYIVSPNAVDGEFAVRLLKEHHVTATALGSLRDLARVLSTDTACLVLVEDGLTAEDVPTLREALENLPPWCDMPLIVVARDTGAVGDGFAQAFPQSGNVTLLQRPLSPHSLVSAVRVALRASARQREVGQLLAERKQAVDLRDEFLAMLAHELRNPLASMRNATYLLRRLDLADARAVKSTAILDRQVTHLTRLVDDLMDVERLERSKVVMQTEPADLNRIVASAVESSLPMAQARGHRISVRQGAAQLPVQADVVRMEQVVCNLLNNAAKFSPEPGTIRLETSAAGGFATVSVSDDGGGFDAATAQGLFVPFLQAKQTIARSAGGLGLGLTIVRRLVELHGGTVRGSSDGLGRGASFTVSLPLRDNPPPASTAGGVVQGGAQQRLRIVLIEDNADIRETTRELLTAWGHEVFTASDGISGLNEVLARQPDVALVDVGLPGMNGYEVAQAIRREAPAAIRLVAVTGYGQPADKTQASSAGFDAHLLKPIDLDALQKLLKYTDRLPA